jgi:hypothetical protein
MLLDWLFNEEEERRSRRLKFIVIIHILSKQKRKFKHLLDEKGRRRRNRSIPRCALHPPKLAAWQRICDSKGDGAMITVTGFDCATFDSLLSLFAPMFGSYTPWIATGDKLRYRRKSLTLMHVPVLFGSFMV